MAYGGKDGMTNLLKGVFKQSTSWAINLDVARQLVRLAQIPKLSEFPPEASLILHGHSVHSFRPTEKSTVSAGLDNYQQRKIVEVGISHIL